MENGTQNALTDYPNPFVVWSLVQQYQIICRVLGSDGQMVIIKQRNDIKGI